MADNTFINPYTFFPIENQPDREQHTFRTEGSLSGYIDITMTVREGSPLFIPNTTNNFPLTVTDSNGKTMEHPRYVFRSYADLSKENMLTNGLRRPKNPVIPGSELRGMVRNVYEQLTDSCFPCIDKNNLPYRRSVQPGDICIMKWSETKSCWLLFVNIQYNIDYFKVRNFAGTLKNGDRVTYQAQTHTILKSPEGNFFIHIPAPFGKPNGTNGIVYTAKNLKDEDGAPISEESLRRFSYVLGTKEYSNDIKGGYTTDVCRDPKAKEMAKLTADMYKNKTPILVYVDRNSVSDIKADKKSHAKQKPNYDNMYISPSAIGKEFYVNTIEKLLETEENKKHQPCKNRGQLCPACRLFGMVSEDGNVCGHLRFSDMTANRGIWYGNEVTLPILGTPRISSTEFYLQKPEGDVPFWTYDYYLSGVNRIPYIPQLSGRKVYWNSKFNTDTYQRKTNMNCTVTPIKKGSFSSRIYFDRISDEALERLLFCLELDKNAYHKIGHGKPIGMGQVQVKVDAVRCTSYKIENGNIVEREYGYKRDNSLCNAIRNLEPARWILKYTKDLPDRDNIAYPNNGTNPEIYKWFSKNRNMSTTSPEIYQTLPRLTDSNQKLNNTTIR